MPPPAAPSAPDPQRIAEALRARVIGQEPAVKEMAIALSKHLAGLSTGNILMIGSSGTGKTTLMRAVEGFLESQEDPSRQPVVVRLHANVLAEEARRGRPGEVVVERLLERAREKLGPEAVARALRDQGPAAVLERASSGLVFVDEIDKIRSVVGGRANVEGIRAQEALLTLIENEAVPVELPEWAGGATTTFDSSRLLFVCAGAFEGLYDAVYDRVTIGRDRGALQPVNVMEGADVRQAHDFRLRDWLRHEDLFDYGLTPQFISRFDAVVLLRDLGVEELTRIFLESPDSGYRQAREFFSTRGVRLALSPAAVAKIAAAASRQPRLGARALREVFRRVIRDHEFEPEAASANGALLIDEADVEEALG
jgi:ATP-dependent Clp protease ATP-binding subunit ClpX